MEDNENIKHVDVGMIQGIICGIELALILGIYLVLKRYLDLFAGECFLTICLAYYIHTTTKLALLNAKKKDKEIDGQAKEDAES